LHGVKPQNLPDAQAITAAAFSKEADPLCIGAFNLFCAMLGTFAGNAAMTFGAKGGVFIAGGILPRYAEKLASSPFRTRFEAKGRLSNYVTRIPTYLVMHDAPPLQGLVNLLAQHKG
jgi:glucokinase